MNLLSPGWCFCQSLTRAGARKGIYGVKAKAAAAEHSAAPHGTGAGISAAHPVGANETGEGRRERNLRVLAILIVAAGFVIRLVFSSRSFFNPDEALLYLFSDQNSLWEAYRASLGTAHPPLLILFLYFWKFLGRSELMLRLPSVVAGAGFCWFTFRWVETALGRTAGLIALAVVAFSPTMIGIAIELRQYSLLLFFMAGALYYLESAIREASAGKMLWFVLFEYLAILTHYSAIFFVVAAGVYALVRLAERRLPGKAVAAWVAGECGAAGIYAVLFVTHVWKVRSVIPVWAGGYNQFFFRGGFADIFGFLRERTPPVFQYFFGEKYVAQVMLVLWIAALAMLLVRGLFRQRGDGHSTTSLGLLLLLPFLALWGAVAIGKYPYYPGRHVVVLAPFAIAAVSALLATLVRQKVWAGLALAALVTVVASTAGYASDSFPITPDQRRDLMTAAVRYIRQNIPANEPILLDNQSSMVAAYYLCAPGEAGAFYGTEQELVPFRCEGHSYTALNYRAWMLTDKNLPAKFRKLAQERDLKAGSRVWIVQFSWRADLDADLRENLPEFRCLVSARFGKEIAVFPLVVGPDLSPAPVAPCGK